MFNKSIISTAILLALSHNAYAEDTQEQNQFEKVVVTATRSNQTLGNTAASVTVVSADEIERNLNKDLKDIFDDVPGVSVNSADRQGIQNINIRGIEGNRVKILVDGMTQGQSYDGGTTGFINSSAIYIDPDMIKNVQIVKGAASSLYGSDAVGGVVAFETKDPVDFIKEGNNTGGQVKLSYSSKDKSFAENVIVAHRSGDLDSLVSVTRRDGKEVQNFRHSDDEASYSADSQDTAKNDIMLKLQYQLNDDHRIEFIGEDIHNQTDSDIYNANYTGYTGDDTTDKVRLGLKHIWYSHLGMADSIVSQVNWQDKKESNLTHRTSSYSSSYEKKDYVYESKKWEGETQLNKKVTLLGNEHQFTYGANYSYADITNSFVTDTTTSSGTTTSAETVYTPDVKEQKFGVFVQDQISFLNGDLLVTPGLRYDWFNTDPSDVDGESYDSYSDSALTARLGSVYHLNQQNSLFAQVSQGFRAPSFDELYYIYSHPEYGYESIPNADLKAEKSISYELGYRNSNRFSASEISVFYSDYDDFIDQTNQAGDNGLTQYYYTNIDKAKIRGIELANTLRWDELVGAPEGLNTKTVAAYTEGEDGDGEPLDSVNPWNAIVSLNYDSPNQTWGSSVKVNYTAAKHSGDISSSSQTEMPSATVVNITAYYKPIKDLTLSAGVFNLTNKEYYSWNNVRGRNQLYSSDTEAKRNFAVSAKYQF
ncbi:TonB-dependent hemoglobin/transferrin/lactoferrin family receptor [Vibrio tritonius]|uniref:TonB-dependent hemoglobin/transferrin/lactoferrin family receptor n=1 Tax=Vibrio tritonius TaxID=1435069 RepID=A0ABS7YQR3_9VIBR|nr:TonB-dependent hemoglobin/transferrin/lactoferrin family receptor [Vibrio tritonius]MCA2018029.1 TonB-dependent hemoglobin/transferrin/lactoferrin family receptor [Vibrio tritonius]